MADSLTTSVAINFAVGSQNKNTTLATARGVKNTIRPIVAVGDE